MELLWGLVLLRVKIRFKETWFGFLWLFLQPIALTVVFTMLFHRWGREGFEGVPYPLFVALGLTFWSVTALVVLHSANSLTSHQVFLKRFAVPKLLLPLSVVAAAFVDLAAMGILLGGLFVIYQPSLSWEVAWVLPILAIHVALLVGLSCLVSITHVFLRDVGQATPLLVQLWFFASPVFYPSSWVPKELCALAAWNPMTGLIEGYRAALLQGRMPSFDFLSPAAIVSLGMLVVGLLLFWRLERVATDIL